MLPGLRRRLFSHARMNSFSPRFCGSPRDFEKAARDWIASWGFADACVTVDGPDGGIDVAAVGAVAQVRAWMTPIGLGEIQRLKGAAHDGRAAFFFSLMDYTKEARDFADRADVRLFRFCGYDGGVEASNSAAVRFLAELAQSSGGAENDLDLCEGLDSLVYQELVEVALAALSLATLSDGYAILSHSSRDDRYVQFHAGSLTVLECVGREFTAYGPAELTRLIEIGWPATEEFDAGKRMNFSYPLPAEPDLAELARVAVETLVGVHGVRSPEDLSVIVDGGLVD